MGLHEVLMNTLESLASENTVTSWSIFNEKGGQISVRIRFQSTDSVNHDTESHYKKKSAKQVQRDRERGQAWRATRNPTQVFAVPSIDVQTEPCLPVIPPGANASSGNRMLTRSQCQNVHSNNSSPEAMRSESQTAESSNLTDIPVELENDQLQSVIDSSLLSSCESDRSTVCDSTVAISSVQHGSCDTSEDDLQNSDREPATKSEDDSDDSKILPETGMTMGQLKECLDQAFDRFYNEPICPPDPP